MKDIAIADVRNFALLGHTGCGKTTLLDAILYKLGAHERKGSPEDGTSVSDYTDEEKNHQISIWSKPFEAVFKSKAGKSFGIVAIDTPGYADFQGQVAAATSVADSAMILVDASSGIQIGTTRSWKRCEQLGLPRGIVITGLDKENADYEGTLASIQEMWGSKCFPVTVPTADASQVFKVLDAANPPDEVAERVSELKGELVEIAAESDDALIEKYLGGEELSAEEIAAGLHGAVRDGNLVPVFAVSAKTDAGLDELLYGISLLYPSPLDCPHKDASGEAVQADAEAPFSGMVWRTVNDPFAGQLAFIRVFSGTLKSNSDVQNTSKRSKEHVGHIFLMNGKKQQEVASAHPGDIVAIPKLKATGLNDSLCAQGHEIVYAPIDFPKPVAAYSVEPKTRGDEDKMATALHRITDEDATITLQRNDETGEFILAGLGDVQLEVALEMMKTRNKVEVNLQTPKVAYKETLTANGEGHYRHKKQSGGRGQFGEVYLRVEPRDPSDEEWFKNAIVGGAIPSNFVPAVEKGLVEGLQKGPVAGYPVTNVKVTLYDGSYHDVDSSEIAFKIAAARGLSDAISNAKPVLLEPIMKVKVLVPDQFMGDINGDLNHKRGRILGMGTESGMQMIEAAVPQAEMFKYSSEMRSMTGGQGSFEMEFDRYEIVPANIAQKVIAEAQKEQDED